jgi:hypothetical protein
VRLYCVKYVFLLHHKWNLLSVRTYRVKYLLLLLHHKCMGAKWTTPSNPLSRKCNGLDDFLLARNGQGLKAFCLDVQPLPHGRVIVPRP